MPEINMPKLSDTMTEGTLVSWKKQKGDQVSAGEVLAEIETDKATMEWEATDDGVLTEVYVQEGEKVNVGDRIAFIGEEGGSAAPAKSVEKEEEKTEEEEEEKAEPAKKKKAQPETEKAAPAEAHGPATAPPRESAPNKKSAPKTAPKQKEEAPRESSEQRVKASPLARKIAASEGIDLTKIKGTGPGSRIVQEDVLAAAATGKTAKTTAPEIAAGESARISLTGMRKIIAERLVTSKGPVPHFYLNIEINADALMRVRAELRFAGEEDDNAKITVNDFILKGAVVAALREPKVNASFDGDAIVHYGDINLAVAVAIEEGLVTPVIRAAQNKSLREISAAVKDFAHRARRKRMKPEEFQGGTLTVSNLGSYGIDSFSAIINPPQAIILAVGAIVRRPVVNDAGTIVAGYRMNICLSCDHRVVDGAIGADYLKALRQVLENPSLLLI